MIGSNLSLPAFSPVGEQALLIHFDGIPIPDANRRVRALDGRLLRSSIKGVQEWIPALASLLVLYNPQQVALIDVENWVKGCVASLAEAESQPPQRIEIPVRYGGEDGPDLPFVAEYHGLTRAEVVERHTAQVYYVGMMGFMPGFAYLLELDPAIATPRLATPRTKVPAGSVGIAGDLTGIYPQASPGGWRLIGRTDISLFNPQQKPYFILSPGDEVRFIPEKSSVLT